jgi:hypothetical protein
MSERHALFLSPHAPLATTAATHHAGPTSGHRSYRSRLLDMPHPSVFRAASGGPMRLRRDAPSPDGATIHQLDARRPVEPPNDPVA